MGRTIFRQPLVLLFLFVIFFTNSNSSFGNSASQTSEKKHSLLGSTVSTCAKIVSKVGGLNIPSKGILSLPFKASFFALEGLAYPATALARFVYHLVYPESRPRRSARRAFVSETVKIAIFMSIFGIVNATTTTHDRIDSELPAKIEEVIGQNESIVVVDGFYDDDELRHYARFRESRYEKLGLNSVFIDHENVVGPIEERLKQIARDYGPIKVLELHGHGEAGELMLGNITFNLDLVEELEGVFAEEAMIILYACESAEGEKGKYLLEAIGFAWLDKGGIVVGSKAPLIPNIFEHMFTYREIDPPPFTSDEYVYPQLLSPPFVLGKRLISGEAQENFRTGKGFYLFPIRKVEIPPRAGE